MAAARIRSRSPSPPTSPEARGEALKSAVEDGAALLAVCGGYQLLGHEYCSADGGVMPGIGLFDLATRAGQERFIGNVVIDSPFGELVGFENHSGVTLLGPTAEPLGRVRVGRGNNGQDRTEGVLYKNAAGCYLHGSVLPKNPAFADWLLTSALSRRHGAMALTPLDDTFERAAHASAVERAHRTR